MRDQSCRPSRPLALLTLVASTLGGRPQTTRSAWPEPVWSWRTPGGVEWAAPIGSGQQPSLIVALADGRVYLLDPATGRQRLTAPIAAAPGVRLAAGQSATLAVCFDRHAVYALSLGQPCGLRWRYGPDPGGTAVFPSDPEALTGWIHAYVTAAGVLLASSGGRVVLLASSDGQPRWQFELGRLPLSRLQVSDGRAAVLWKAAGATRAAFINLETPRPVPSIRDLGGDWPLWSELIPDGLVTASAGRLTLWREDGTSHGFDLETAVPRGISIAASLHGSGSDAVSLLLVADREFLIAYDLPSGRKVWQSNHRLSEEAGIAPTLTVLDRRGVLVGDRGALVCDLITGEARGRRYWAGLDPPVSWHFTDGELASLHHAGPTCLARAVLTRARLTGKFDDRQASRPSPPDCELNVYSDLRQVLWTQRHLVLVLPDGLQAYALP